MYCLEQILSFPGNIEASQGDIFGGRRVGSSLGHSMKLPGATIKLDQVSWCRSLEGVLLKVLQFSAGRKE